MEQLSFQPLGTEDLERLCEWLNATHVKEFWDAEGYSLAAVEKKFLPRITGEVPVSGFNILLGSRPIGYIQAYWLADFPEYNWKISPVIGNRTAALDVFIGETDVLGKGIGSLAVKQFLQDYIFGTMNAQDCVVSPNEENARAIKAYAKAGFKYLKTIACANGRPSEHIMKIDRANCDC